jgi:hypothetical protein
MRPANYYKDGEMCMGTIVRDSTQMVVGVLKQKLGPANFSKWVYFDPIYNKLEELETKAAQRPGGAR